MAEDFFKYSYSAREQEEINEILKKYIPKQETDSAILEIKKLDRRVTNRANAAGISAGIIGLLILGFGMSCVLVWQDTLFALGVIIGIVGIAVTASAYHIYKLVLKRERKKAAPQIMRLAKAEPNSESGADNEEQK